jgi:hypothetical protein
MNTRLLLTAALAAGLALPSARATLLAYENFNQPGGSNAIAGSFGVGSFGFTNNWTTLGDPNGANILSPGFAYAGLKSAGNRAQIFNAAALGDGQPTYFYRTLATPFVVPGGSVGTLWASFLIQSTAAQQEGLSAAVGFFSPAVITASTFEGITIGAVGQNPHYRVAHRSLNTSHSGVVLTSAVDAGTYALAVVKLTINTNAGANELVSLWLNPDLSGFDGTEDSLGAPVISNESIGNLGFGEVRSIGFGSNYVNTEGPVLGLDEIRLGTSLASVLPAPTPAPAGSQVAFIQGLNSYAHVGASLRSGQADTNYGTNQQLLVGLVAGADRMRGALSFPLPGLPEGATITSASLELTTDEVAGAGNLGAVELRAVDGTPEESSVTWNLRANGQPWLNPGGDLVGPVLSSVPGFNATATLQMKTFPSSAAFVAAVQSAYDQGRPLDLIALSPQSEAAPDSTPEGQTAPNQFARFASDDHPVSSRRPRLVLTYTLPSDLTPFGQWLQDQGLPEDTDPEADLNGDGLSVLLAYALGGSAVENSASLLPAVTSSGDRLSITFIRAVGDVTYQVLGASSLTGVWEGIATNPGTVGGAVTVVDSELISENSRRFLRLQVTK